MRKMIMMLIGALLVVGLATPAFAVEARPTNRDRQQSQESWRGHDRDGWQHFDHHDWRRHDHDGWRRHDRDDRWWFRDWRDRDRDRGDRDRD
jgi:hypothetical protein